MNGLPKNKSMSESSRLAPCFFTVDKYRLNEQKISETASKRMQPDILVLLHSSKNGNKY